MVPNPLDLRETAAPAAAAAPKPSGSAPTPQLKEQAAREQEEMANGMRTRFTKDVAEYFREQHAAQVDADRAASEARLAPLRAKELARSRAITAAPPTLLDSEAAKLDAQLKQRLAANR